LKIKQIETSAYSFQETALASYMATGGGELVNPIGVRLQVNKMVVQKNLREIIAVCKTPKNPLQIPH